jgi:hypothetical protein
MMEIARCLYETFIVEFLLVYVQNLVVLRLLVSQCYFGSSLPCSGGVRRCDRSLDLTVTESRTPELFHPRGSVVEGIQGV